MLMNMKISRWSKVDTSRTRLFVKWCESKVIYKQ